MGDKLTDLKQKLLKLLEKEALKKGEFVLSSGEKSNYYLDGRIITLSAEGAYLVAEIILTLLGDEDIDAIGGPTLGADPIAGAIAALSRLKQRPINTFIVRKRSKEHGTQRRIEGPPLEKNNRVILIDDVATTGKALLEAKAALDELGVSVKKAIVIVDRNQGARENLAKAGVELAAIFNIKDFGI